VSTDEAGWKPFVSDPQVRIGHVHLKVADLGRALGFYSRVLGLEITARLSDSAAFLSAGGYHHHIALNTWESLGGSPPPPGNGLVSHRDPVPDSSGPCGSPAPRPVREDCSRRRSRSRRKRIHLPPGSRWQRRGIDVAPSERAMAPLTRRSAHHVYAAVGSPGFAHRGHCRNHVGFWSPRSVIPVRIPGWNSRLAPDLETFSAHL